jgi:hypothetical protein
MIKFIFNRLKTSRSVISGFRLVQTLNLLDQDARIYGKNKNYQLEKFFSQTSFLLKGLRVEEDDILVFDDLRFLMRYKKESARKILWLRGNLAALSYLKKVKKLKARKNFKFPKYELLVESETVGKMSGKNFRLMPFFVDDYFFQDFSYSKIYDIIIEGEVEKNSRVDQAYQIAQELTSDERILWMNREGQDLVIDNFKNHNLKEQPSEFHRTKFFLKLSDSFDISIPFLEAMASDCIVITSPANLFHKLFKSHKNCIIVDSSQSIFMYLKAMLSKDDIFGKRLREKIIKNGFKTVQNYRVGNTINIFLNYIYDQKKG